MAKILNAIIITVLFYSIKIQCADEICIKKNSCLCEFSDNSKIDLSELISKDKISDFLQDKINEDTYYFHGCTDGHLNVTYNNKTLTLTGSLIRSRNNKQDSQVDVLGNSNEIVFNPLKDGHNSYEILYKKGETVSASIRLMCDNFNEPFIKVINNNPANPKLVLSSPHACVIVNHHPGLSFGAILLILLFVPAGLYFIYVIISVFVFYRIHRVMDISYVPQIEFWRELPGLIKDGAVFLLSGCRVSTITTAETYDRI